MKKLYLVLALLFALSACSVGKKCVVTDEESRVDTNQVQPMNLEVAQVLQPQILQLLI